MVANKADNAPMFPRSSEFIRLGFGEAVCVSATNSMNKHVMMETVIERLKELDWGETKRCGYENCRCRQTKCRQKQLCKRHTRQRSNDSKRNSRTTRDAVDIRF